MKMSNPYDLSNAAFRAAQRKQLSVTDRKDRWFTRAENVSGDVDRQNTCLLVIALALLSGAAGACLVAGI
jgi:hypothetical protein